MVVICNSTRILDHVTMIWRIGELPAEVPVKEAARILLVSDATIRRRLQKHELTAVVGKNPVVVERESLLRAVEERLARMGLVPHQDVADVESELRERRGDLNNLTIAFQQLRMAHSLLLDSVGTLAPTEIANS